MRMEGSVLELEVSKSLSKIGSDLELPPGFQAHLSECMLRKSFFLRPEKKGFKRGLFLAMRGQSSDRIPDSFLLWLVNLPPPPPPNIPPPEIAGLMIRAY